MAQISTPQDKIFLHLSLAKKPKMHRPSPHFVIFGYYFRWQISVTGQTNTSRHKFKPIFSQQKQILSLQKQNVHDRNKNSQGESLSYSGNDLRTERLPSQSHEIWRNLVNSMTNLSLKTSTWVVRKTLSRCYTLKLLAETCVQRRCETCFNRRCNV